MIGLPALARRPRCESPLHRGARERLREPLAEKCLDPVQVRQIHSPSKTDKAGIEEPRSTASRALKYGGKALKYRRTRALKYGREKPRVQRHNRCLQACHAKAVVLDGSCRTSAAALVLQSPVPVLLRQLRTCPFSDSRFFLSCRQSTSELLLLSNVYKRSVLASCLQRIEVTCSRAPWIC